MKKKLNPRILFGFLAVNGVKIWAILDTGAGKSFISKRLVATQNNRIHKRDGPIKTASKAVKLARVEFVHIAIKIEKFKCE